VILSLGSDTTVVGAGSAKVARETLQADADFDLVLLDLHLGDADGFEVLAEFRRTYRAAVVVVSASRSPQRRDQVHRPRPMARAQARQQRLAVRGAEHGDVRRHLHPAMTLGSEPAPSSPEADTVPSVLRVVREQAQDSGFPTAALPLANIGLTPRQTDVLALLLKACQQADRARAQPLRSNGEGPRRRSAARAQRQLTHAGRAGVGQMSSQGGLAAWRNPAR